ncbi:hypothetical protein M0R45_001892 [Rubus argutus]|uniref:Endonuclease/exonuclease/phosphatase domain-containing protein n=1 Tax=Rubus argutus TaxID=59490 RepID=A0AAW1VL10_RUBAR
MLSLGQSGGLALFWKEDIDVRFRSKSHHHIDVMVDSASPSLPTWRFTGFYGHPSQTERFRSWSLLRELSDEHSLPWVVMGDFNELLHAHEKVGGWRRTERQMQGFHDALSYGDLFDIGYLGMSFTWKDSETKCRLDRVVASATWTDLFSVARVTHLPPSRSDHIPLLLGVYASNPPACSFHHRFRFESFWIQDDGCGSVVQHEASTLQSAHLQSILEGLLQQESDYWKQRAKVIWLTNGDRNTKYFHRKAPNRRAKNMIKGLFDSDGVWQDSDIGLENIVLNYFDNMFRAGTLHPEQLNEVTNLIKPSITQEMNIDLCSPYSEEEIHLALSKCILLSLQGLTDASSIFSTILDYSWTLYSFGSSKLSSHRSVVEGK